MKTHSTEFRVGLFAVGGLLGVVLAVLALGWTHGRKATVRYETYFDESVQGLDLGSPVKYRGVRIGSVSDISIAPDRVHVRVGLALARADAKRLGIGDLETRLRAQLATQGITGVKFVDIDIVDAGAPLPVLPFTPGARYLPSRPSLLTGLQDNIETVVRDLPRLVDRGTAALESLRRVLDDIHDHEIAARVATLASHLDEATADMRTWIATLQRARLPENAASILAGLRQTAQKLDTVLDDLRGTGALLSSAKRAADTLGDLGRGARGTAKELDHTLREVAESARAIRDLAELLERDPDALVRGRSTPRTR